MKLLEKDYKITYVGNVGTITHRPTRLRAIRIASGMTHSEFEAMLKDIMTRMLSSLDDYGNYLPQCKHCKESVEAAHYSMCKACWWERDPRNSSNVRAEVLQTLMDNMPPHCDAGHKGCTTVHQNSGLFIDDEKESMYIRELEYWRSTWNCSLDEAAARCYTNEYSVTRFKMWLETLFVDIVY